MTPTLNHPIELNNIPFAGILAGISFVFGIVLAAKGHHAERGILYVISITLDIFTLLMVITKLRLKVFSLPPPPPCDKVNLAF